MLVMKNGFLRVIREWRFFIFPTILSVLNIRSSWNESWDEFVLSLWLAWKSQSELSQPFVVPVLTTPSHSTSVRKYSVAETESGVWLVIPSLMSNPCNFQRFGSMPGTFILGLTPGIRVLVGVTSTSDPQCDFRKDKLRRFCMALRNLKRYRDQLDARSRKQYDCSAISSVPFISQKPCTQNLYRR